MNVNWNQPGYPQRHYDELRKAWRYARNATILTGVPFLVLLLGTLRSSVPAEVTALAGAIFVLVGVVGSVAGLSDARWQARVHPYFQRQLGEIETFASGKTLARYLNQLDIVAAEVGVKPLSAFGFNDDLRGEQLQWHATADGLATVEALLQWLDKATVPPAIRSALIHELNKWRQALERARFEGVRFCILFRHANVTSGHEWDVRAGSAF